MKKIAIGADHAGFERKVSVGQHLTAIGYSVLDVGTHSPDSVDYPEFGHLVANAIESGQAEMGITLCGSGNGIAIAANKHPGIRAALCWTPEIAALARRHNNANVLSIPARFVTEVEALEIVDIFLNTSFEGGRHANRVAKIPI